MRKFIFIPVLLTLITAYTLFSCRQKKQAPEKIIEQKLLLQIDSFSVLKNKLLVAVKNGPVNEKQLQQLFLQTRLSYKKFEWAAEYFSPAGSRVINGPPVQEVEMSSGQIFEPAGLQVIEGLLFPKYNIANKHQLIQQLVLLQAVCDKYKTYFNNIDIFNWQVFDAAKLEVFRILSLGITGFDNPLTLKSMQESAVSLKSLQPILANYTSDNNTDKLMIEINNAVGYLQDNTNFSTFNRAAFITGYGNPITVSITELEKSLNIHVVTYNRLLRQDAKTLFDINAFNPDAYAPDQSSFINDRKTALGKVLFADPILSGTKSRSCQSCHQPEKAFTDGLVKNVAVNSNKLLRRNTPTLINAGLQPSQFYDLRVNTLEDQAQNVVENKEEMHGSMQLAAKRLWQNISYRKIFSDVFPKKNRTAIDTLEIVNVLGCYIRSLTLLNSRFDEYMRGNKAAMDQQELNGFNLFMGKAKCATCHYMPLFNGTFPPRYIKIESEVIGVPHLINKTAVIDTDKGRYNILKIPAFKYAFKTTTVRNAALTAPYMHNGVFANLQQVIDFYNKGGGAGMGMKLDNQTLALDKLNLTTKESDEIIAFIKCLNSK